MNKSADESDGPRGLHAALKSSAVYNLWQRIAGSRHFKKKLVEELLSLTPDMRMLDIGCGTGEILDFISPGLNLEYVGTDISPEYISRASSRYSGRGTFLCQDATAPLEHQDYFDLALLLGLLHHLNDQTCIGALSRAVEALKPGGMLRIIEPLRRPSAGLLERVLMAHDRGQYVRTLDEYISLMRALPLQIETFVWEKPFTIPWTLIVISGRRVN